MNANLWLKQVFHWLRTRKQVRSTVDKISNLFKQISPLVGHKLHGSIYKIALTRGG